MNNQIILIGGGGHCKSCIDVIEAENKYKIVGIIDMKDKIGSKVLDYPVIGSDDDLAKLTKQYNNFFITVGQIKNFKTRTNIFNELKKIGVIFPIIVSPLAHVARTAQIGEGSIIMHNVLINTDAVIGKNCIINNNSLIEHESIIGDNVHIATGSIVNGQCEVGANSFIGSRSVLANNVQIPSGTVIGAGSVVINSLLEPGTYVGNPARLI